MKTKTLMRCLLAAALAGGMSAASMNVLALTPDEATSLVVSAVEQIDYIWERNDTIGLTLPLDGDVMGITLLKDGHLLATSLLSRYLRVENGQVTIGAALLNQLSDGDNKLSLVTREKTVDLTIHVTPVQAEEPAENNTGTTDSPDTLDTPTVTDLSADQLVFEWDRNSSEGLVIRTNSRSRAFTVSGLRLFVSSLTSELLSIKEGIVTLEKAFLDKLDNGDNSLTLDLGEGKLTVTIHVTGDHPEASTDDKILTADTTDFTWDRHSLVGLAIKTNSSSRKVTIMKGDTVIATDKDLGVYMLAGKVRLMTNILQKLDNGDNDVVFTFDDGSLPVHIHVTDEGSKPIQLLPQSIQTSFTWQKDSGDSLVIETDSRSKSVTIKKNGQLLGADVSGQVSIEDGKITLKADLLKQLTNGENHLTLELKDGDLAIDVTVIDHEQDGTPEDKTITAEETIFTWDRSSLTGIAVKTNSSSKKVSITKDGATLFTEEDLGVYITLGRVRLTARNLRKLPNGENHLLLVLEDGTLPITVNITDRNHTADTDEDITADKTVFTWKRGSNDSVVVKTNSASETAAVRQSRQLALVGDKKSITIQEGTVTLTPAYLSTLPDGSNDLILLLDDGKLNITVNVIGIVAEQSTGRSSSSTSVVRPTGSFSGDFPATGRAALALGSVLVAGTAGAVGIVTAMKKRRKKP